MSNVGVIDKHTGAFVTIDLEHHRIHAGNHYYVASFVTLNSDASLYFGVRTPVDTDAHFTFEVNASSQVETYIYEGGSWTNGTAVTPLNNNRNLPS